MKPLDRAKDALKGENVTFALADQKGNVFCSEKKGIAPMMELLEKDPERLRDAFAADRVIGKAAAYLLVYGGAAEVYGSVMSRHAITVLQEAGISFSFEKEVPYIINRKKDGMCPMEAAVLEAADEKEAYAILCEKTGGNL